MLGMLGRLVLSIIGCGSDSSIYLPQWRRASASPNMACLRLQTSTNPLVARRNPQPAPQNAGPRTIQNAPPIDITNVNGV